MVCQTQSHLEKDSSTQDLRFIGIPKRTLTEYVVFKHVNDKAPKMKKNFKKDAELMPEGTWH